MRACIVRRQRLIAPFGATVDECPLGGETFAAYRTRSLAALSLSVDDVDDDTPIEGPALVMADDVWATTRALRGFLSACSGRTTSARLSLPASTMLEISLPLQDIDVADDGRAAFDVAYVAPNTKATPRELFALGPDAATWVQPPFREVILEAPAPRFILGHKDPTVKAPVTSTVVMRIRHWVHILRASHLAPSVFLIESAAAHPVRALWMGARALRLSRAATLTALRRRMVFVGKRTRIHPTAVVEASVIGNDVDIGPHASVIGSVVGDHCYIEDRAHVNVSTLGAQTMVSRNSSMSATVTFGDTDACANGIQACVVGPRVGLTSFARPLDIVPGGEVSVIDDGRKRSVGALPCGVAFGPDSFVGAGVVIAAGRMVPAGTRILQDAAFTLSRIGDDVAGKTVRVVDGRAIVVDEL